MKFSGFIFDFDGLILNTEMPRFSAWQEVFRRYGVDVTVQDYWKVIGTRLEADDPIQDLIEQTNGRVTREEFERTSDVRANELLEKAELLPGVEHFIKQAFQAGKPMVISSSSSREWVYGHLHKYGLFQYFRAVFTAEDVEKVKPEPDLYLLAVNSLALPKEDILVFEDSPNGIKAAKAAGLHCVAVPNRITREMDLGQADQIIESFVGLSPHNSFTFNK